MMQRKAVRGGELAVVMDTIEDVLRDGVKHGYFEIAICVKKLPMNDREVVIKAGKNYRHVISQDEADGQPHT